MTVLESGPNSKLAFVSGFQPRLLVFARLPFGDFVQAASSTVGAGPRAVVVVQDRLVTANASGEGLSVARFEDGPFEDTLEVEATVGLTTAPFHVAARSGSSRVFVTLGLTDEDRTIRVFERSGSTLLAAVEPTPVQGAVSCAVEDFDRDGDDDALVLSPANSTATLLEAEDDRLRVRDTFSTCPTAFSAKVADVDGNGSRDAVLACRSGGVDVLFDPFEPKNRRRLHLDGGDTLYDAAADDFDGDGSIDLAGVDLAGSVFVWLGRDALSSSTSFSVSRGPIAIEAMDVEGDGDVDLVVLGFETRAFEVLENTLMTGGINS